MKWRNKYNIFPILEYSDLGNGSVLFPLPAGINVTDVDLAGCNQISRMISTPNHILETCLSADSVSDSPRRIYVNIFIDPEKQTCIIQ